MRKNSLILWSLGLLVSLTISAGAKTIYVATTGDDEGGDGTEINPYATIQHAIDVAEEGDTIDAAAGTYQEHLVWEDKSLILQGAGAGNSIVDGGKEGRCLTIANVPETGRVEGFTFQNGVAEYGGGLYLDRSPITLIDNEISGNVAARNDNYGSRGGGLYLDYSAAILTHNMISGNSVRDGELVPRGGGGLAIWHSSPTLTNNTIADNIGEGVYARYSSPVITNNTIADNTGEGVYARYSSPVITNCILWGNEGDGDLIDATATYSCIGTGETTGEGNISEDPQFVNSEDYHLQPTSPCINQGSNDAPELPDTDIDDHPRILYEIVDMGADEVSHLIDLQPDLWIKQISTWLGDNTYNDDGTDQTASRTIGSGQTRVYRARLYNDSDEEENFWVQGPGGDTDWTVQYYGGGSVNPAKEVTAKVTSTKGWKRTNVPPGGRRNFVIAVTPAPGVVGDYSVLVQAISDSDPTQLDCVQALTTVPDVQPDLHIKKGPVWGGDDIYNDDGTDQKASRKVADGTPALFKARLENDGMDKDHFYIHGLAGGADWTVQYYRGLKVDASKEVTAEVTSAEGWKRPNVAPEAFCNFLVVVTPNSGLEEGSRYVALVRAEARRDPSQRDAIQNITQVKAE